MPPGAVSDPIQDLPRGLKRKEAPRPSSNNNNNNNHHQRSRDPKRVKLLDARSILAQKPDAALKDGDLDLQAFLRSREFEIKALQDGMERSKNSRTTRAFQQVPRDLRRRTASHNVKRVPRRLHKKALREMREDNTPTVDSSKRKPRSTRSRIRAETAKRLGLLAEKKQAQLKAAGIETRPARPKIRKDTLNDPPKVKSKYRKRQINKTWLPTHLWHAKRAKTTEPKSPLWRFALPITSTEKSYRPTHRAGGARGCVVWDISYFSTISLEGSESGLEKIFRAIGITEKSLWEKKGQKWRDGKRSWTGWLSREVNAKYVQIAPSTVFWCPPDTLSPVSDCPDQSTISPKRRVFVRVHPAAYLETWEEVLRVAKSQRPVVHIEDLRYEIGSIEITGPASTETLLSILHPFTVKNEIQDSHASAFQALAGVTNPSTLPSNSLLSFNIFDPRIFSPPRPAKLPDQNDQVSYNQLLEILSSWPVDSSIGSQALFDREARYRAIVLPSQNAINRRKSLAPPGQYAGVTSRDPAIPIVLLASKSASDSTAQGSWTILAPWKCILPIWHGILHYPLSTGGNPRFGGLDELRQLHFEHGMPWFPADFPGTSAGFAWEQEQRSKNQTEWNRRPKGKRVEWASLDLGAGRRGEIGCGWACDFEKIVELNTLPLPLIPDDTTQATTTTDASLMPESKDKESKFTHMLAKDFQHLINSPNTISPPLNALATIRLTLTTRGVATSNARIYQLPPTNHPDSLGTTSINNLTSSIPVASRSGWLSLLSVKSQRPSNPGQKQTRIPLNIPLPKRMRLMAQSLLEPPPTEEGGANYPLVPDADDLIGFVTTGSFNLAEGKGVAVGSVCVAKVLEGLRRDDGMMGKEKRNNEGRLCIVRNAGESVGRLAKWEVV